MKKVGLYFGSFSPCHDGHIVTIKAVLDFVDEVKIIPTPQNPQKKKSDLLPFDLRVDILNVELSNANLINRVTVDLCETLLETPNYTANTLKFIANRDKNDELYIIGGTDVINSLPTWKESNYIQSNFSFIHIERDNGILSNNAATIYRTVKLNNKCSSTLVRSIMNTPNVKYKNVNKYISMESFHKYKRYIMKMKKNKVRYKQYYKYSFADIMIGRAKRRYKILYLCIIFFIFILAALLGL